MSIIRVGVDETAATPNTSAAVSLAVPISGSAQAGDYVLVDVVNTSPGTGTTNTPPTPEGWERVGTVHDAGTPSVHLTTFAKAWAGETAVSVTFAACNAVATTGVRRSDTGGEVRWVDEETAFLPKDGGANTARLAGPIVTTAPRVVRSVFGDRSGSTHTALADTVTGTRILPSSAAVAAQETGTAAAGTYQRSATATVSTSVAVTAIYTLTETAPTSGGAVAATLPLPAAQFAGNVAALLRSGNQGIQGVDRVRVACRTTGATGVRLAVSTDPSMTAPAYGALVVPDAQGYAQVETAGLPTDTDLWWQIELDGVLVGEVGRSRTLPAAGAAASFSFVAAACMADTVRPVWDTMRTRTGPGGRRPLFLAHLGDAHYTWSGGAVAPDDAAALRAAHEAVLGADKQRQTYRDVPTSYVWSDTDFGGSNSDSTWAGNATHQAVYRQLYASPTPTVGAYRSWVAGRVRMVHTDGRSLSTAKSAPDDPAKSLLGATQKAWFKAELIAARDAGQVVVWLHDNDWAGAAQTPDGTRDNWRAYSTERAELADFITTNSVPVLAYVHGDSHQLAASTGAGVPGGFAVFCVAPLFGTSTATSAPADTGSHPAAGVTGTSQFGWFDIADTGGDVEITFRGVDSAGTERVAYTLSVTPTPALSGDLAAALPPLSAAIAGDVRVGGALSASVSSPIAVLTATVRDSRIPGRLTTSHAATSALIAAHAARPGLAATHH